MHPFFIISLADDKGSQIQEIRHVEPPIIIRSRGGSRPVGVRNNCYPSIFKPSNLDGLARTAENRREVLEAMSGIALYDVAVPTFTKGLKTFDHILRKAEAFARENGDDPNAVFAEARLIEDQLPLIFQVQNATRTVRINVDRLTGVESKPFEDTEKTFEDLHARIQAARELLATIDADIANSRANESVEV
jgi:hypothetical protein